LEEASGGIEELFFELASESRIAILRKLSQGSMKMQELGRTLDLTATETFRQLQRLCEASLLTKMVDGNYSLTSYGKAILFLCPSFEFLLKHKPYFLEHDIWQLPTEFIFRLGELSKGALKSNIPENLNHVEEMIKGAEKYLWTLSSQILAAHSRIMIERCQKGLKFRSIHPRELIPSEVHVPEISHCIERRYLAQLPGILVVTEKEALVALPFINGKQDYAAFFGSDPAFIKWVTDLHQHYWMQGESIHRGISSATKLENSGH
jgi:predicted transcriptional regulator